jgi:ubiquitin carboxyl-terminal hydrolase L3
VNIESGSLIESLLTTCVPLEPYGRALALEASEDLEAAHTDAAKEGDTTVPTNAEDEVDFHYVCLVQSHKNNHLYEMDGRKKGPVCRAPLLNEDGDVMDGGLNLVKEFIQREKGENLNFSLMALVSAE